MKASIYIRLDMDDGSVDRRVVEYQSPKDGPWSPALRGLADAYYVGETAKGMVADMVGGPAHVAFSSPASRARRAAEEGRSWKAVPTRPDPGRRR